MNLECLSPQDKFSAGSAGAVPGHKSIPWAQGIPAEGQSHPHKGGTAELWAGQGEVSVLCLGLEPNFGSRSQIFPT